MTVSIIASSKQWLLSCYKEIFLLKTTVSFRVAALLFVLLGISAALQHPGKSFVCWLAKEALLLEDCEE